MTHFRVGTILLYTHTYSLASNSHTHWIGREYDEDVNFAPDASNPAARVTVCQSTSFERRTRRRDDFYVSMLAVVNGHYVSFTDFVGKYDAGGNAIP